MKHTLIPILCLLFTTALLSQTKNFLDVPYLETSARVDTLVTPDKIYLSITIQEKDSKGRKSVEEQENQMATRLKALGINLDKQLVIKDLSSNFKKYFLRQKEVLKSKQYSLLVYSGKKAGEVMVALEKLDISNTYLEKTEYSKMDALELELKSKAVKKAKKKAEALTSPLGQNVGTAIHIMDVSTPYYPRYNQAPRMEMKTMDAVEAEPLDIDFEKIKVETSVNVKFKISE
ncbi:SIMPL domain-containing protein [Flagellimonas sp. HMM57]|uniref:SIMPL domain-containing protein n=1 Tax=unclassified Flagellimonas TaxID=2644544 RepID=UPI0013D3D205|nr:MULTISPECIES: SIMPL domain-containing protein [unclassified Flagellimonas]UII77330.1 SIMPL domain-containing protein [Flagellimonas sp. HMM57]